MKRSLLILLICLPVFFYGQTTTTFSVGGNQTFVSPAGVTSITVKAWGAGGAGGSSTNPGFNGARGGSGGGGGAFASAPLTITSGETLAVIVGLGGKGVSGVNGNAGGFSAITGYAIKADGGKGGLVNNGDFPVGGIGGLDTASSGTIKISGSSGQAGESGFTDSSGSIISSGAGGNAANGGGIGGAGLNTAFVSDIGNIGTPPGGGGSGGRSSFLTSSKRGGDGGDGKVIITYNCPTYSLASTTASSVNICSGSASEITLTGTLPIGLYAVAYEIQGVAQTPAAMNVTTTGTGIFIASGFTTVGTRTIKITSLTSGSSTIATENCTSTIIANNLATVTVNSSGTVPVALAGTGATCNQITANWQAVSGVTYYELDVSTENTFATFVTGYNARNVGNVLTFNVTGLVNDTYYYRVRAYNGNCISTSSNTITYATIVAPGVPTATAGSGRTCSQITANWTSVSGATSYSIDVSTQTGSNFNANILTAYNNLNVGNVLIKDITGLSANTNYYYRVRATNNCGTSTNSSIITYNTSTTAAGVPATPTATAGTGQTCSQFTANWSLAARASSYIIDVSTQNGGAFAGNILAAYNNLNVGNVLTFDVTGLSANTNYYYRVRATNTCGTSTSSSVVTYGTTTGGAGTPSIPTANSGTGQTCSQITANWASANRATSYIIDVSTQSGANFNANILALYNNLNVGNVLTKNITGLSANTTYYYRVRATNNCGTSTNSSVITYATTAVTATPTISANGALTFCQTDGVTLTSSAASNNVWSTGETTQSIFVSAAGSYTVQVVNPGGCNSAISLPKVITIEGLPTAIAGGNQTICSNQSATVSGASASNGTIKWTFSGGAGILANDTSLTPTYTPVLGGAARTVVLTMTVTSTNSCAPQIATANYTIHIQGAPTALISGSQSTCSNGSITVVAGEASATNGTVLWTHDGTGTISGATTLTPTYTAAAADAGKQVTLTMTVTSSPICSASYTVSDIYPVIVRAENTVGNASLSPVLCINTLMSNITHATTGATGIGTPINLPAGVSATWSANTITISGTPTVSGIFNYSIPLMGGCSSVNAIGTIVVNLNTASIESSVTTCANILMANITHTTSGATGIGIPINLPAGVSANWSSNTITISGTPIATGTFNYSVPLTGGCGNSTATGTIIVNALPPTPITGRVVQPTCLNPTGSISLSGLLATPNWVITQNGTVFQTYNSSSTTYSISNLAPGTYTFTIQDGLNCPSLPTVSIEIKAPITNVWNGLVWSKGSDPIDTDIIEFDGDYQSTGDLRGCSCKVNSGKKVIINSGHTLTIENGLTVDSSTGTELTFENNASLMQHNNAVNNGNITYKRNTTLVRRYDFTHWSSPVTRTPIFTLKDLSPNTLADKYYKYDPINGWIIIYNGTEAMLPGIGYIIRAPQYYDINIASIYNGSFIGVPNNGPVSIPLIAAEKWNLIGNPYPSAVYADQFISDNSANLYGTLYFWTHNSLPSDAIAGDAKYNYRSDDYAVYNITGGVGIGGLNGTGAGTSGNQDPPLGYIAAGQSFFVKSKTASNAIFHNSMRISGNNNQFFKNTNSNTMEKSRIWLNLTNTQGAFKQILVGYIEGATNMWDDNFDAVTINGNSFVDFYSINDAKKLTIQARALPFNNNDQVTLGYSSTIAADFTIAIDHADGNLSSQAIYLEDKTTGSIYDLRVSNYTFTTTVGTFADRFVLRYTNKTLGNIDFENSENHVLVSVKDKVIKVTSTKEPLKEVFIFDVSGKLLYNKKKIGTTELQISNLQSGNQVLFVKVVLENDYRVNNKIIF